MSNFKYTFPPNGETTESVTLIGNTKYWIEPKKKKVKNEALVKDGAIIVAHFDLSSNDPNNPPK